MPLSSKMSPLYEQYILVNMVDLPTVEKQFVAPIFSMESKPSPEINKFIF
jgi:hypothetical protein